MRKPDGLKKRIKEAMKKTTIWMDVIGYEGLYQISNTGNVFSLRSNIILNASITNGYRRLKFYKDGSKKNVSIARLVATHFIPNPKNKPEVNHINGKKHDDRSCNLEWCTPKENINHADKKGLRVVHGEYNKNSKLKWSDVSIIRSLKGSLTQLEIADKFNVCEDTVHKIHTNKSWIHGR